MGSRPCEVTRCDGTERPGVAIGRVAWSPPCVVATVVAKILASSPTNHICYGCGRTLLFQIVQELHAYAAAPPPSLVPLQLIVFVCSFVQATLVQLMVAD